jgi:thiol-disulfide isomerase/thioredoxin
MDMHELLGTAVADLPDAPDLVPEARRIHRRRTLRVRTGAVAAAAALAVGAGTLTIAAPWNRAGTTTVAVATSDPSSPAYAAPDRIHRIPPGARTPAPVLTDTTIAGKAYTTAYTGHVTVINVWGSWCTACREEAPALSETAQKYTPTGVQFLGIDTYDKEVEGFEYEAQYGIPYPSLADPEGALALSLKAIIPTDAVPSTIIVDKTGKVAVAIVGTVTAAELTAQIAYAQAA